MPAQPTVALREARLGQPFGYHPKIGGYTDLYNHLLGVMNKWGIPDWLEREVRSRDTHCVYCGVQMINKAPRGSPRKAVATWEHVVNDARIVTRENIALCCASCNSSKGQKPLAVWLTSESCKRRGITDGTIAPIIKEALQAESNSAQPVVQPDGFASAPLRQSRGLT